MPITGKIPNVSIPAVIGQAFDGKIPVYLALDEENGADYILKDFDLEPFDSDNDPPDAEVPPEEPDTDRTVVGDEATDDQTVVGARARDIGAGDGGDIVNSKPPSIDDDIVSQLQHELEVMRHLKHDNVINFSHAFVDGYHIKVLAPLMHFGSCRDMLSAHFTTGLPEKVVALLLRETLNGVSYIHASGFIHRSLRTSHLLVDSKGSVKIAGFRNAISMMHEGRKLPRLHSVPIQPVKSVMWYSPELLAQDLQGYDERSDIYSLGIVACELATGQVPFEHLSLTDILSEKLRGNPVELLAYEDQLDDYQIGVTSEGSVTSGSESGAATPHKTKPRTFSKRLHKFVSSCVQPDPEQRPLADALLKHSFFKQVSRVSCHTLPESLKPLKPLTELLAAVGRTAPTN